MSVFNDAFEAFRDVLLMQAKIKELADDVEAVAAEIRDQDRRLIRLETMVEIAGVRSSPRRLPRND